MNDAKSVDPKSSSESRSEGSPFDRYLQILCILVLVLFALYLIENFAVSIENASNRWMSKRAFNLDLKLSLLFELSHLLALPFVLYSLVKDMLQGGLNET